MGCRLAPFAAGGQGGRTGGDGAARETESAFAAPSEHHDSALCRCGPPSLSLCLCVRARRRHRRPFAFLFGFLLCSVSLLVQPGDFRRRLCWWWLTSDNKPLPPPPLSRFYPFGEVLTQFAYGWTDEEQGSKQGRGVVCETGHCLDSSFKICVHSAYSPLTPFPFVFFSFFWLRCNDKQRRCRVLRFLEFVCERREAQERIWRSFLYMEGIRVLM
jgi:hypothetical protein